MDTPKKKIRKLKLTKTKLEKLDQDVLENVRGGSFHTSFIGYYYRYYHPTYAFV